MARIENYDGNLQSNIQRYPLSLYGGQNFGLPAQQFIPNQPVMRNIIKFIL